MRLNPLPSPSSSFTSFLFFFFFFSIPAFLLSSCGQFIPCCSDFTTATATFPSNPSNESRTDDSEEAGNVMSTPTASVTQEVQEARRKLMKLRGIGQRVGPLMRDLKKLIPPPSPPPQPSESLNNALKDGIAKLIVLNKALASLRTVRNNLVHSRDEISSKFAPLHKEADAALVSIRASVDKAFNKARVRLEAVEMNFQKEVKIIKTDLKGTENSIHSIPDGLPRLDDKETEVQNAVGLFLRFSNVKAMAQKVREDLAQLKMEKYTVSQEGIRDELNNLDFIIERDATDQSNTDAPLETEFTDQVVLHSIC
ncbi:unnamed protein product [Hydatigera taeniaeformis]|uniref:SynN domain-containing protein n=1 Tax=Hydatigena taeniaeformis TaxID=6205 RepID=A0A0R3WMG1_HYDTA|nr:unnamed protein product [Hydatigera taeniaeformis]